MKVLLWILMVIIETWNVSSAYLKGLFQKDMVIHAANYNGPDRRLSNMYYTGENRRHLFAW